MVARLGQVLYWALSGLAGLSLIIAGLAAFAGYMHPRGDGVFIAVVAAAASVGFYLIGRASLYVLAGR